MIIQNKLEAAKYSLFLRIILGVNGILIAMMFILMAPTDLLFTKGMLAIAAATYIAFLIRMPHYFVYSDGDTNYITIRYYNVHPLWVKPRQLKIPKGYISKVEVKSYLFGWRKTLHISVITKTGEAQYKPVNISLLTKEQAQKLKNHLLAWKRH